MDLLKNDKNEIIIETKTDSITLDHSVSREIWVHEEVREAIEMLEELLNDEELARCNITALANLYCQRKVEMAQAMQDFCIESAMRDFRDLMEEQEELGELAYN